MPYLHRRLRKASAPAPKWIIRVPFALDHALAQHIREAWLRAGREGVAIIDSRITIDRLGR